MSKESIQIEEIDAGEPVYSWESWEFAPSHRSTLWYILATLFCTGLIIYAVMTNNYLFALIVLMISIIFLVNNLRKPRRQMIHITDNGVVVGEEFYAFQDLKDIAIVYLPPDIKLLYIDFHKFYMPLMTIDLDAADPNIIRQALLPFVFENLDREEETAADLARRLYKL